jgi:hypothetical protein
VDALAATSAPTCVQDHTRGTHDLCHQLPASYTPSRHPGSENHSCRLSHSLTAIRSSVRAQPPPPRPTYHPSHVASNSQGIGHGHHHSCSHPSMCSSGALRPSATLSSECLMKEEPSHARIHPPSSPAASTPSLIIREGSGSSANDDSLETRPHRDTDWRVSPVGCAPGSSVRLTQINPVGPDSKAAAQCSALPGHAPLPASDRELSGHYVEPSQGSAAPRAPVPCVGTSDGKRDSTSGNRCLVKSPSEPLTFQAFLERIARDYNMKMGGHFVPCWLCGVVQKEWCMKWFAWEPHLAEQRPVVSRQRQGKNHLMHTCFSCFVLSYLVSSFCRKPRSDQDAARRFLEVLLASLLPAMNCDFVFLLASHVSDLIVSTMSVKGVDMLLYSSP